ncbi:hypothetical protein HTVC048P_gp48 [Pelagibacter phage HTVC048P]|nr:hypothetical protein HTVC048P_gp48 [Pelagibacter phage HTVC048P]
MATLNLGRIKPVFRGAYAGGTAYVVDDIVTSGNETFICIQAGTGNATSNASYWTKLAAKGADGTDVGATLTTQGDILYRDGSGLQRLAAGTSGQFLKTQGSGANPTWAGVTSAILQMKSVSFGDTFSTSTSTHTGTSATECTPATLTITPTSATSLIRVDYTFQCTHDGDYMGLYFLTYNHSGISETSLENDHTYGSTRSFDRSTNTTSDTGFGISGTVFLDPQTTNAVTVKHRFSSTNSGHTTYINQCANGNTSNDPSAGVCTVVLTEIAGSSITHSKVNNIVGD